MEINGIDITQKLSDGMILKLKVYLESLNEDKRNEIILEIIDKSDIPNDGILGLNLSKITTPEQLVMVLEYGDKKLEEEEAIKDAKTKKILAVYSESELAEIKTLLRDCQVKSSMNMRDFSSMHNHIATHTDKFFDVKIQLFEGLVDNLKKLKSLNKL